MRACALLLLGLAGCPGPGAPNARPGPPGPASAPAAQPAFTVALEQSGQPVEIVDHRAELSRGPFDIVVDAADPREGILMNVSFDDELFKMAGRDDRLTDIFQPGTGMAEEAVLQDPTLILGGRMAHHYLIYEPSEPINRYHEVKPAGGRYRCVRHVAGLIVDSTSIQIEKTREPALYLVFFLGRSVMGKQMERHREWVELRFLR
jgi:hypothetical protein